MKVSVAQVNYLNIVLILISCAAAYVLPFQLFLFAYAVLGPLHYLTEISWLQKNTYFTKGKYDYVYLMVLSIAITVMVNSGVELQKASSIPIYVAFFCSLAFLLIKQMKVKILACVLITISGFGFHLMGTDNWFWLMIGVFLPTIIHVSIFTGSFMLYGAIKEKGNTGYITFVVFLICSAIFFFYDPSFIQYRVKSDVVDLYWGSNFRVVNYALMKHFTDLDVGTGTRLKYSMFFSDTGISIMRFIAFAYTYHYLNWFSKTTIIKWHKISWTRFAIIFVLWGVSVGLYYFDYMLGFKWLFLLSILHVYLEFPLNFKTFIVIGKGIGGSKQKASA